MKHALLTFLLLTLAAPYNASAQQGSLGIPCLDTMSPPAGFTFTGSACATIPQGSFTATPLMDGCPNPGPNGCPSYGDPDKNQVSLYGAYGDNENNAQFPLAQSHYQKGITLAANIKPLCTDGSTTNTVCSNNNQPPAVVFLFIGFSNPDIEVCGGDADTWQGQDGTLLQGQPCATQCPNPTSLPNGPNSPPWNQVAGDPITQQSFLYLVYPPSGPSLVGQHVVVFDGAFGQQVLSTWDPTSIGYYFTHPCTFGGAHQNDPECNYDRVRHDLKANGYSELQVQAIFLKSADGVPNCDLKKLYCPGGGTADAYVAETYLGDIMRYLKSGLSGGGARYSNLQQVFLTSRIYGGWANGQMAQGQYV